MLNRLVANVDGEEDDFVDIERPGNRHSSSGRFRLWYILLGLVILFPYLSIFVLFGMYGDIKKSTTNNVSAPHIMTI